MNNFGVSLVGKSGIYNKDQFYKAGAQKATRTFIFEGGPGCDPTVGGGLGLEFGAHTVSGRWTSDGERDVLDVRAFECYLDTEGREVCPNVVEEVTEVAVALPRGETQAAPAVKVAKEILEDAGLAPKPAKEKKPAAPPVDEATLRGIFDKARAAMKPGKDACKNGHPITFENANPADLRRMEKYCCKPCIKGYAR